METALRMAQEQQQQQMMEMASRSNNGASVMQAAQQANAAALQKFQVPDYYPVGIELDKALAHPGSDADIVLREGDRITKATLQRYSENQRCCNVPELRGICKGKERQLLH